MRKPFAAATWEGELWGVDLKIVLVIAQVIGYALSKLLGIRLVPEVAPRRRAAYLLALVGAAELALVAFAVLPPSLRPLAMFLNGLPLGLVWGLVFSHLEGRRSSELLGAGLSTSYIVASGMVKTVGRALMDHAHVSEAWMPAATGVVFFPLFRVRVASVRSTPPARQIGRPAPSAPPWTPRPAGDSFRLARAHPLTALYVLTAFRDFRDNSSGSSLMSWPSPTPPPSPRPRPSRRFRCSRPRGDLRPP